MVYTLYFFSSKCSLFHNSNVFGSCIIHTLYTECAKIKKKFRRQKVEMFPIEDPRYGKSFPLETDFRSVHAPLKMDFNIQFR